MPHRSSIDWCLRVEFGLHSQIPPTQLVVRFILGLQRPRRVHSQIPPTQLVVRFILGLQRRTTHALPNPTNAVGGLFIPGLQAQRREASPESHQRSWWIVNTRPTSATPRLLPNPTNEVGGLFIHNLHWRAVSESTREKASRNRLCRPGMNNPPTAVGGIREKPFGVALVGRV